MRLSKESWFYKKKHDGRSRTAPAKKPNTSAGTFEGYVNDKASSLEGEEQIRFLLDSIPFIQDYETQTRMMDAGDRTSAGGEGARGDPHSSGVSRMIDGELRRNPKTVLSRFRVQRKDYSEDDFSEAMKADRIEHSGTQYACDACGGYNLLVDAATAERMCGDCGALKRGDVHTSLDTSHGVAPSEQDHVELETRFCYKRINHFNEWLASLQGRENTDIPAEIVEQVRQEFVKARLNDPDEITQIRTRQILKKIGCAKLYEHSYHICRLLGGKSADLIPRELEAKLKTMFQTIQQPFETVKPATRKNFLSYSYTLYKFLELLGHDEYLPYLPLLKSPEKLFNQDKIWRAVCAILNWQFIPTV